MARISSCQLRVVKRNDIDIATAQAICTFLFIVGGARSESIFIYYCHHCHSIFMRKDLIKMFTDEI